MCVRVYICPQATATTCPAMSKRRRRTRADSDPARPQISVIIPRSISSRSVAVIAVRSPTPPPPLLLLRPHSRRRPICASGEPRPRNAKCEMRNAKCEMEGVCLSFLSMKKKPPQLSGKIRVCVTFLPFWNDMCTFSFRFVSFLFVSFRHLATHYRENTHT